MASDRLSQLVSLDMPTVTGRWEFGPMEHGYDIRRCTVCSGRQAWIWNTWVDDGKQPCSCAHLEEGPR